MKYFALGSLMPSSVGETNEANQDGYEHNVYLHCYGFKHGHGYAFETYMYNCTIVHHM